MIITEIETSQVIKVPFQRPMKAGVHNHLLPYEGDMDLSLYLAALVEVGFEGGLALDLYQHDYEAVARDSISYIRGLLEKVTG